MDCLSLSVLWPSAKARRVFAALKRIGWRHDRTVGSHKIMKKNGFVIVPPTKAGSHRSTSG
jgi:predicted RNA binding protein YcfA (HicA-like mRNA interferase family)